MNKNLYKLINEQFNIGNMDLNNSKKQHSNIFNKATVNPYNIYEKMVKLSIKMEDINIKEWEIQQLNQLTSVVKVNNDNRQIKLIAYIYSHMYPNDSMNWLDVSDIENMSYLFNTSMYDDKTNIYNGDISKWDVSNVTNMRSMFTNTIFNGDISGWDVSNVNDMACMFQTSEFNQDISGWDVSNVKDMRQMFEESQFNRDISKWDVSNVIFMSSMFCNSVFNRDISKWDVSNVQNMSYMFYKSEFNQDISRWDVSKVKNMREMFKYSEFNQDISGWDLFSVGEYDEMLKGCPLEKYFTPTLGLYLRKNKYNYNQDE